MKSNSIILAPFGYMTSPKMTDKICPYFKGWTPARIILRLYSILKLMAKNEARFSMAQIVYACGLKDQSKTLEGNTARMAIINAFMYLAGTGFIEYQTAEEMHGKKPCYVLWPTKFNVPSRDRYMAFITRGEIDEEGKVATEELSKIS